jgi:DNA processing protein
MADKIEKAALIALLRHYPRMGRQLTYAAELHGSALAIFEGKVSLDPCDKASSPPPALAVDLSTIIDEIEGWESDGHRFVTILDDEYPTNLRTIYDRPPFVFIQGSMEPRDAFSVAIVGTRKASPEGKARASRLATALAQKGVTIASGLAAGIDTAAHTAVLAAGGRTLAVIGTGLRKHYPPENADLQHEIAKKGAVVSQFWPDSPPAKFHFPMRNAVMSGMTMATIVIEASHTSGAKMQARLALEHGRWVFLLRSLVDSFDWAKGYAKRPGTTIVEGVDDVLERLEILRKGPPVLAP